MIYKVEREDRRERVVNGCKDDTNFGDMILTEAKRVYGDGFEFLRCYIEANKGGFVVTFLQDSSKHISQIRDRNILVTEREDLRGYIKMVLFDEYAGIGEEQIDFIEEDILKALGMGIKD